MVTYFGLSEKIGNLSFYDSSGQNDYFFQKPYSEKTAELIDKEAKDIIDEQYARAISILNQHKEGLILLAEQLLEKEVIFSEDLEKIFGKRKFNIPEVVPKKLAKTSKPVKRLGVPKSGVAKGLKIGPKAN